MNAYLPTARHAAASIATSVILLIAFTACGENGRTGQMLGVPDSVDALSLRLSTFHRDPTQRNLDGIAAGFARHDGKLTDVSTLMGSFFIFAATAHGLEVAQCPASKAKSAFLKTDRARFSQWLADESTSPEKNDVLWMEFFVTGKELPLDRILAVADADMTQMAEGKPMIIDMAGSTAAWSYRSNAQQWPEVLAHARKRQDTSAVAASAVAGASAKTGDGANRSP